MSGGPQLPASIGRYIPVGVLGSGAMGTVFKAHDPAIGRMVAIKVIRTDALDQEMRDEYIERFKREVQAAGRCSHAAIVGVYDFSGDATNPYIVMEMVEGTPLHSMLRDPARRLETPIVPILTQVLEGLGYAHRLGITHRDVKPGNILVTPEGRAKIVDFGIARLAEGSMTQAGSMLGTPSYMSPEQVSEDDVDYRADLFSVGAILYEALVGKPPFVGRNLSDTILRLSLPDPAPMEPVVAAGGGAFVPVLMRALAKPRDQRFQSAEEFAAELAAVRATRLPPPDSTVLMPSHLMPPSRQMPPPLTAAMPPQVPPGSMGGSLDGAMFDGRWDSAVLQRIERALAPHVGPMARVMLRDAARTSNTAEELVLALARSMTNAADRSQFLRALSTDRVEPTLMAGSGGRPGAGTVGPPSMGGQTLMRQTTMGQTTMGQTTMGQTSIGQAGGINPAAVEAAQAALVVFVGPMARVLARKAAADATSAQDFIERLCAHVPKVEDNNALRRKLRADVEPKLR